MGFSCDCRYQDLEEILALTYHLDPKERRRALQQMCPCQIMEGDMLWDRIIEMRWDKDKKVRGQALDFLSKLKRLYSDPDKNARKMCITYQRKRKRKIKIAVGGGALAVVGGGALAVVGIGGGAILGALLAPLVLPALGFGAAGVTAGSVAAAVMTSTTAAGSVFAIAQSAGATGAAVGTITAIGAGAGAVVGAVGGAGAGAGGGALIGVGTALKKTS